MKIPVELICEKHKRNFRPRNCHECEFLLQAAKVLNMQEELMDMISDLVDEGGMSQSEADAIIDDMKKQMDWVFA